MRRAVRAILILRAQRAFFAAARPLKLIVSWRLGSVASFLDVSVHLCIHFSMWTGMSGIRPKPRRILPNTRYTLRTLPYLWKPRRLLPSLILTLWAKSGSLLWLRTQLAESW